MTGISSRKVAVLATDGVEQVELTEPVRALKEAGASVTIIAPSGRSIQGMNHHEKADSLPVDATLAEVKASQFDALLLPGGVANADTLRAIPDAVMFVHRIVQAGKPVAAICHAPWMLIEVDAVRGRLLTSWPSLRTDLKNAGAEWIDQPVVVDAPLVTSRKPDDLPAFCREMIRLFDDPAGVQAAAYG
ncbi:MAG TPA: type 1 glutamine amidotransferase domain-containing protein [Rhodopila sp.]|uniref:type 1 glutamine amidotransferase domain-containing protein n=1 Tax=Rhodopila sp. TaxID=2480087 RepID=UPI002CD1F85A|nr:type 1 glutamine amidotransferase domain-containing protein [Rhodopila sp.]HVY15388.1 type 1 glutamine amidotransferase domain-containing protein [Rhodopila sp.]